MQIDRLQDVRAARIAAGRLYEEFLRTSSMSAGLYELPAGSADPQQPHTEDELYYVVAGRATFECSGERRQISPGDTIFVEAHASHRFVEITQTLSLLVVFAPAEPGHTRGRDLVQVTGLLCGIDPVDERLPELRHPVGLGRAGDRRRDQDQALHP